MQRTMKQWNRCWGFLLGVTWKDQDCWSSVLERTERIRRKRKLEVILEREILTIDGNWPLRPLFDLLYISIESEHLVVSIRERYLLSRCFLCRFHLSSSCLYCFSSQLWFFASVSNEPRMKEKWSSLSFSILLLLLQSLPNVWVNHHPSKNPILHHHWNSSNQWFSRCSCHRDGLTWNHHRTRIDRDRCFPILLDSDHGRVVSFESIVGNYFRSHLKFDSAEKETN